MLRDNKQLMCEAIKNDALINEYNKRKNILLNNNESTIEVDLLIKNRLSEIVKNYNNK